MNPSLDYPPSWAQQPVSPVSDSDVHEVEVEVQEREFAPAAKHDDWISFIVEIG